MDTLGHIRVAILGLMVLLPNVCHTSEGGKCFCSGPRENPDQLSALHEDLSFDTMVAPFIHCCPQHLLGPHNLTDVKIIWNFKSIQYPWESSLSTLRAWYCGNETLESDGILPEDEGVLSCTLLSFSTGLPLLTKTFSICVNVNLDRKAPPVKLSITNETWALPKTKDVTLQCSAFVGRTRCGATDFGTEDDITWMKQAKDGSWEPAKELRYIRINKVKDVSGKISSSLVVELVGAGHYGRYRCTITNRHGSIELDTTLWKGVDPEKREGLELRACLVVLLAAVGVLSVVILFWHRCHLALALYFTQSTRHPLMPASNLMDVLLVHGDSAAGWVGSVLVPLLEHTCHYTCFLPHRDMWPGSVILEEIASAVWRCRRVVVVVTPSLLQCPWAAWALHHALQASLKGHVRIIALRLQDIKPNFAKLPDHADVMKNLKMLRSIRVPSSCGLQMIQNEEESKHCGNKLEHNQEKEEGKRMCLENDKEVKFKQREKGRSLKAKQLVRDEAKCAKEERQIERKERMSRLEIPKCSRSRLNSRSRSRSPLDCTWRLIDEEEGQEDETRHPFFSGKITEEQRPVRRERRKSCDIHEYLKPGLMLSLTKITKDPKQAEYLKPKKYPVNEFSKSDLMLNLPKINEYQMQAGWGTPKNCDVGDFLKPSMCLSVPMLHQPPGSPGNQRLSNMIHGCSSASRGNLEKDRTWEGDKNVEKDKRMGRDKHVGGIKKVERDKHVGAHNKVGDRTLLTPEFQDPESPTSLSPFINTPIKPPVLVQGRGVWESLRLLCTGDPEVVFWHSLIYRLGPPLSTAQQV